MVLQNPGILSKGSQLQQSHTPIFAAVLNRIILNIYQRIPIHTAQRTLVTFGLHGVVFKIAAFYN